MVLFLVTCVSSYRVHLSRAMAYLSGISCLVIKKAAVREDNLSEYPCEFELDQSILHSQDVLTSHLAPYIVL